MSRNGKGLNLEPSKFSRGLWTLLGLSLFLNLVLLAFISRHFQISISPKPLAFAQNPYRRIGAFHIVVD